MNLQELARLGALERIKHLELEIIELKKFAGKPVANASAGKAQLRRKRQMSAAQRAKVSKWMRAYWAKRRSGKLSKAS